MGWVGRGVEGQSDSDLGTVRDHSPLTSDPVGKLGPNPISPSRELGPLPVRVYIKSGLIERVSRATSAIGPEPTVPVPAGASANSASVLAARESEHQRPTRRKRLRREVGAVG